MTFLPRKCDSGCWCEALIKHPTQVLETDFLNMTWNWQAKRWHKLDEWFLQIDFGSNRFAEMQKSGIVSHKLQAWRTRHKFPLSPTKKRREFENRKLNAPPTTTINVSRIHRRTQTNSVVEPASDLSREFLALSMPRWDLRCCSTHFPQSHRNLIAKLLVTTRRRETNTEIHYLSHDSETLKTSHKWKVCQRDSDAPDYVSCCGSFSFSAIQMFLWINQTNIFVSFFVGIRK